MTTCPLRLPALRLALPVLFAVLLGLGPSLAAPGRAAQGSRQLAEAEALLEEGRSEEALALLLPLLEKSRPSGETLMLASTARFMNGDTAGGFADLERALEIDPTLRQGWLNLAGLEIAERRYDAAHAALLEAEKLDPDAEDNHLNLGAVLVLGGKLEPAKERFRRYLAARPGSAEAYYLVATNYALGGYEEEAVESLARAIEIDERLRLKARSDDRFASLASQRYLKLLSTDSYRPGSGALTSAAAFEVPYDRRDPELLYATLEALQELDEPHDPMVEATDGWALIWGDLRIKVSNQANGTGVVSLSAPASMGSTAFQRRAQALLQAVHELLNAPPSLPAAARKGPGG